MEYVGFSVLWWVAVFMPTFAQERNAVGESVTVDPSGRFGTPPQWSTVEHYVHNWVQQVLFYSQCTFRVLLRRADKVTQRYYARTFIQVPWFE